MIPVMMVESKKKLTFGSYFFKKATQTDSKSKTMSCVLASSPGLVLRTSIDSCKEVKQELLGEHNF